MKSAEKFWYTGSIVVAMLIAGGLGFVFLTSPKNTSVEIQPFITYTNSSIDLIEVTSPLPGASVEKEFIVSGNKWDQPPFNSV